MLELSHAELELVDVVARDEVQLVGRGADERENLLGELPCAAAQTTRDLYEELLQDVGDAVATARAHAASSDDAGAAAHAAPGPPAPTARPARRRRAPASA